MLSPIIDNEHTAAIAIAPRQRNPRLTATRALEMAFQDYAPNTRRAYARIFRNFQEWAKIQDLNGFGQLDSLIVLEYKDYLKTQGNGPASINQSMSALKKICKVLKEFDYLTHNPFDSTIVRSEKVKPGSNKGSLRVAQLTAMIEANQSFVYDERIHELLRTRNGILLRFLYLTAARRSEAANLQWPDVQQDGDFFVAILRKTKSGVLQRLKLRQELHRELMAWRQMLERYKIDTPWVFPSLGFRTCGHQMTGKGINDIIVRLGKEIGLQISAHFLRHTAITLALEIGEPLQKVQAYARHASANTTIRYFHDQNLLQKNPTDRLPMI